MHVWGPRMKRRQTETAPKGFCCPHETDRVAHHQAGRGGERLGWHSWQTLHKRVHAVSCSQRKKRFSQEYTSATNADKSTRKAVPTKTGYQSRL